MTATRSFSVEDLRAEIEGHAAIVRENWSKGGAKYLGFHAFILAHGTVFKARPLPRGYRRASMGACFQNAFKLAKRRGLVYVEGFAARAEAGYVPILHAWCAEPGSDFVIDSTWGQGELYLGVAINLIYRQLQGGSVLDNWQKGWPILQATTLESEWKYRE